MTVEQKRFSRLRNSTFRDVIWPIKSSELKKFLPMAFLMFTVLLNQNLVRGMKDSIVMTLVAPEVISFIKIWLELPSGIVFVLIYARMCNRMTTERAFQYVIITFLIFFATFAFVLFPNSAYFHPSSEVVEQYIAMLPNLKWFIVIWGHWSYVLFYVMGELWPVVVLGLVWQLANKITKTEEAKRFYSFFTFFGQANLLISGLAIGYFASKNHFLIDAFAGVSDRTEIMLKSIMLIVLVSGLCSLLIHMVIERQIINDANLKHIVPKQKTLHLGVLESSKLILRSKYLGLICILMISYSVAVILIEGLWFAKAKELYPNPEQFASYQGMVLFWTGISALIFALLGSSIIRRLGWFFGAIITPVITMIVGGLFFLLTVMQDNLDSMLIGLGQASTLSVIVFCGFLQNVFSKGAKYSLFDATKEMSYIPLDIEIKTKGQAAVDIVGPKIGKTAGALVPFITFTFFPFARYQDISGVLLTVFVVICIIWVVATVALSREYHVLLGLGNQDEK